MSALEGQERRQEELQQALGRTPGSPSPHRLGPGLLLLPLSSPSSSLLPPLFLSVSLPPSPPSPSVLLPVCLSSPLSPLHALCLWPSWCLGVSLPLPPVLPAAPLSLCLGVSPLSCVCSRAWASLGRLPGSSTSTHLPSRQPGLCGEPRVGGDLCLTGPHAGSKSRGEPLCCSHVGHLGTREPLCVHLCVEGAGSAVG